MATAIFISVAIALWIICGYIGWRIRYYGLIKDWFIKFKSDYRTFNDGRNALSEWSGCLLFFSLTGIIGLLVVYFNNEKEELCWYFDEEKVVDK